MVKDPGIVGFESVISITIAALRANFRSCTVIKIYLAQYEGLPTATGTAAITAPTTIVAATTVIATTTATAI